MKWVSSALCLLTVRARAQLATWCSSVPPPCTEQQYCWAAWLMLQPVVLEGRQQEAAAGSHTCRAC
jgi:hypothetical protein